MMFVKVSKLVCRCSLVGQFKKYSVVSAMPSKFRKAIYAVKDQTSISLAKVSASGSGPNATSLEVTILKATTHDDVPLDHRYLAEILLFISSNKSHAAVCVHSIAKRITRTRNWVVALKSLNLVFRIFQEGDPIFPREVLLAMKRGAKILNLSNFRDDSNSNPWDYTAFVRTFALYLDERLDCFLNGKLQKRYTQGKTSRRMNEPIRDMKPTMLIDRISHWQKLLDRAIATRPTGSAKRNRLIQHSLHAVVQESFDLYRDISDGLALLLDSFFHLQHQSCVNAFHACVKAAKQFEELGSFYDVCKSIGVGRTSEYPSVQQPSDELIETLQEFLKDHASFPCHGNRSPPTPTPTPMPMPTQDFLSGPTVKFKDEQSESSDKNSDWGSDFNSFGDIMTAAGSWPSPANSVEYDGECFSDNRQSQSGDFTNESILSPTFPFFEENQKRFQAEEHQLRLGDWELVLAESATPQNWPDFLSPSVGDNMFMKPFTPQQHHHNNNPFLQDSSDLFTVAPTFKAETEMTPTFGGHNLNEAATMAPTFRAETATFLIGVDMGIENDPFAVPWGSELSGNDRSFEGMNHDSLLQQQKLWKEHQNKIIAKHSL